MYRKTKNKSFFCKKRKLSENWRTDFSRILTIYQKKTAHTQCYVQRIVKESALSCHDMLAHFLKQCYYQHFFSLRSQEDVLDLESVLLLMPISLSCNHHESSLIYFGKLLLKAERQLQRKSKGKSSYNSSFLAGYSHFKRADFAAGSATTTYFNFQ